MSNNVSAWMAWEGGVDLAAQYEGKDGSMILVHVAEMVTTPIGAAPSGMILLQEAADAAPSLIGFISTDARIAEYFGPNIFAGTPFENAPGLEASIEISHDGDSCSAEVSVADTRIEVTMSGLSQTTRSTREANAEAPFVQQILERSSTSATLSVNGEDIAIQLFPDGERGEPSAAFTPAGIYSR
ncbi:hypothetical protein NT6N_03740 [Oceaniferula spumae]|uniref:Uncharacterized protein n=1 Tax=Oceaniferula spumae TaxID=2979115 RepID=A0AAT9FH94_9BACT